MQYKVDITTTVIGDGRWLKDYMRQLEGQYGKEFVEQLDDKGVAKLISEDPDGARAVSTYYLYPIRES